MCSVILNLFAKYIIGHMIKIKNCYNRNGGRMCKIISSIANIQKIPILNFVV